MKRIFSKKWPLIIALVVTSHFVHAQIDMPQASPIATLQTKVGLTDVAVEYSRPGLKGRDKKIFGELIPYGEVWRTGANDPTKITFNDKVKIDGKDLAAGTYSIYTIPGTDDWTVIFSKKLEQWGPSGYQDTEDALRVQVKPVTIPLPKETLTIDFSNYTSNSANLTITWDNTQIIVPVETEVDAKVMAQIDEKLQAAEVTPWTYFQAANYYYQQKKDLNQAMEWLNTALKNQEHFLFYNVQSRILADQRKYKEAIKAAEKSKELAQKDNNQDYIKINDELIARYKEKK